jgi:hypothetical protein
MAEMRVRVRVMDKVRFRVGDRGDIEGSSTMAERLWKLK